MKRKLFNTSSPVLNNLEFLNKNLSWLSADKIEMNWDSEVILTAFSRMYQDNLIRLT